MDPHLKNDDIRITIKGVLMWYLTGGEAMNWLVGVRGQGQKMGSDNWLSWVHRISYYNLSSVCGRVCPETTPPFMGWQAPNLTVRSGLGMDLRAPNSAGILAILYDHTINYHELHAWESGWKPHWQGASFWQRLLLHSLTKSALISPCICPQEIQILYMKIKHFINMAISHRKVAKRS